jgi:hypothetical protein
MARFDWFSWDIAYLDSEWFCALTPGQKWAWVALLSKANLDGWHIKRMSFEHLATLISADPKDVEAVISVTLSNGKVTETDSTWFFVNGEKYRRGQSWKQDTTNADRQAKYRQKLKEGVTDSNAVTRDSNGSNAIQDRTGQDNTKQGKSPLPPTTPVDKSTNGLGNRKPDLATSVMIGRLISDLSDVKGNLNENDQGGIR